MHVSYYVEFELRRRRSNEVDSILGPFEVVVAAVPGLTFFTCLFYVPVLGPRVGWWSFC